MHWKGHSQVNVLYKSCISHFKEHITHSYHIISAVLISYTNLKGPRKHYVLHHLIITMLIQSTSMFITQTNCLLECCNSFLLDCMTIAILLHISKYSTTNTVMQSCKSHQLGVINFKYFFSFVLFDGCTYTDYIYRGLLFFK